MTVLLWKSKLFANKQCIIVKAKLPLVFERNNFIEVECPMSWLAWFVSEPVCLLLGIATNRRWGPSIRRRKKKKKSTKPFPCLHSSCTAVYLGHPCEFYVRYLRKIICCQFIFALSVTYEVVRTFSRQCLLSFVS